MCAIEEIYRRAEDHCRGIMFENGRGFIDRWLANFGI